jgi:ABC-type arginine/histidine transport system permease subunit
MTNTLLFWTMYSFEKNNLNINSYLKLVWSCPVVAFSLLNASYMMTILAQPFASVASWKRHKTILSKEETVVEIYADTLSNIKEMKEF